MANKPDPVQLKWLAKQQATQSSFSVFVKAIAPKSIIHKAGYFASHPQTDMTSPGSTGNPLPPKPKEVPWWWANAEEEYTGKITLD